MKKYHAVRTVPTSNRKAVERDNIETPNTEMLDRSPSMLVTDISINNGRLNQFYESKALQITTLINKQTISVHCRKIYNLIVRALETGRKLSFSVLFRSDFIFSDNICIMYLSCNVTKPNPIAKLSEMSFLPFFIFIFYFCCCRLRSRST